MKGNSFDNSAYKMFDNWWKYKENDDAGRLFPACVDKLTKENNKQLVASQRLLWTQVIKTDGLQIHIKSRAFYVCPGRVSSLLHPRSSSCGKIKLNKVGWIIAKIGLNQTKVSLNGWLKHVSEEDLLERSLRCLISLCLLSIKRFLRLSLGGCQWLIRTLIGKEWDPRTWDGDVWEDPIEAKNFKPQNLKSFSHLRE